MKQRSWGMLFEILFVILFFSLSATVVVQLFFSAGQKSRQTQDANRSMQWMQAQVEQLQAGSAEGKTPAAVLDCLPDAKNTYTLYLDDSGKRLSKPGSFRVTLKITDSPTSDGTLRAIQAETVEEAGSRSVGKLSTTVYIPQS